MTMECDGCEELRANQMEMPVNRLFEHFLMKVSNAWKNGSR